MTTKTATAIDKLADLIAVPAIGQTIEDFYRDYPDASVALARVIAAIVKHQAS